MMAAGCDTGGNRPARLEARGRRGVWGVAGVTDEHVSTLPLIANVEEAGDQGWLANWGEM